MCLTLSICPRTTTQRRKLILWATLFVGFALLNVYAFVSGGLAELIAYLSRLGPWGIVASADLILALLIGITWTWRDAHIRDVSPVPFVVLTLLTGSLGLLLYLSVHSRRAPGADRTPIAAGQLAPRVMENA